MLWRQTTPVITSEGFFLPTWLFPPSPPYGNTDKICAVGQAETCIFHILTTIRTHTMTREHSAGCIQCHMRGTKIATMLRDIRPVRFLYLDLDNNTLVPCLCFHQFLFFKLTGSCSLDSLRRGDGNVNCLLPKLVLPTP
jgi:hypothetical protein